MKGITFIFTLNDINLLISFFAYNLIISFVGCLVVGLTTIQSSTQHPVFFYEIFPCQQNAISVAFFIISVLAAVHVV
jgi:hypothetical protein